MNGQVITFNEIGKIPNRRSFLDPELLDSCRTNLLKKEKIEFLPGPVWESFLEENGEKMYKVMMTGILKSGDKITVVLNDIFPYFEVRVPRGKDAAKYKYNLLKNCPDKHRPHHTEIVSGSTIKEYGDTADFIQLYYTSTFGRKSALTHFAVKEETTHNDPTCYYRVVSRDTRTPWVSWCTLENYSATCHSEFKTKYTAVLNYKDIKAYTGDVFADPNLHQDLSVSLLFDIETRDCKSQEIPLPTTRTSEMANISMAFNFIDADIFPTSACMPNDPEYDFPKPKGHLMQINITTMMTAPMSNRITVMCKDEVEMIRTFAIIFGLMKPDYVAGFNSDRYDWWWIVERARQYNLLAYLEKYMSVAVNNGVFRQPGEFIDPGVIPDGKNVKGYAFWKKYALKISADQYHNGACLNYPGYVCIDLMAQLRLAHNNPEKYGLHAFLAMHQLGDKVEMPYKVMFKRFTRNRELLNDLAPANLTWAAIEAAARAIPGAYMFPDDDGDRWFDSVWEATQAAGREMIDVAEYCIVDSERCHDLLLKTNLIRDKREVGKLSFTTMDDCIYNANGMKVRNMIYEYSNRRNLHCNCMPPKDVEEGKFPGAYVFPPKKGIAAPKPSPKEMRASLDYPAWQSMSQMEFERICHKISTNGIYMEEYLPAKTFGSIVEERLLIDNLTAIYMPIQEKADKLKVTLEQYCVDFKDDVPCDIVKHKNMTIKLRALHVIYQERADETVQTLKAFCDDFISDLTETWPQAFLDWLLVDSHYPIAGLDFSSLYPSLMMAYNFSPEMMVHSIQRAAELKKAGKKIHVVNFPFNSRDVKAWTIRSTFPDKQTAIEAILQKILKGSTDPALRVELEELQVIAEFGLFPTILMALFDQRVELKAQLKPLTQSKEEIELMPSEEFLTHAEEYKMVVGKWNYLNSKQKALKVFMNTFYGETGNARSPLRVLALAGGITSSGQYNIKKVAALVQELGCRIYYGDTDSIYSSMPRRAFREYDRAYYSQVGNWSKDEVWQPTASGAPLSKVAYFECLVLRSFKEIKIINLAVNQMLKRDNGTDFLRMAFEEFLFPSEYWCKKKYGGIAHEGGFNSNPKSLFIRGLEFIKKGSNLMLKELSESILWRMFSTDNITPMIKVVEQKIEEIYTAKNLDFEKFVKTASYKPKKQNVSVHTFHDRMLPLGIPPEPFDRFRYVIVKKYPFKFDIKGRKTPLSVGERMEYASRALDLNMEIDLNYYMESTICGQLARFISGDSQFDVEDADETDEAHAESEKKNLKKAVKYIEKCYSKWSVKHVSKGPLLKMLFKRVSDLFHCEFNQVINSKLWQGIDLDESSQIYTQIIKKIDSQCSAESKREYLKIISRMTISNDDIASTIEKRNGYKNLLASRKIPLTKMIFKLCETLHTIVQRLQKIFSKRDYVIQQSITELSNCVGIVDDMEDTEMIVARINALDMTVIKEKINQSIATIIDYKDLVTLSETDALYLKMLSVKKLLLTTELVHNELSSYLLMRTGGAQISTSINHLDDVDAFISDWN